MKVELRLFASLTRYLPDGGGGNSRIIDIDGGLKITEMLDQLQVPEDRRAVILLNGIHANGDEPLKEGDRIGVFPPIAGG